MKWIWLTILALLAVAVLVGLCGCTMTASRVVYDGVGTAAVSVAQGGEKDTVIGVGGMAEGEGPDIGVFGAQTVVTHDEGKSDTWTVHGALSNLAILVFALIFFPF